MKQWKAPVSGGESGLKPKTLVEIYGNERVLVEQHRGILHYGEEEIRVGTGFGCLVIEGLELRLCCMSRSQLVIRGRISGIRMGEGS